MWHDDKYISYRKFEKFYQTNLLSFCIEQEVAIYKKDYEKEYRIGGGFILDEKKRQEILNLEIKTLYLGDYGSQFVRYLLDNANDTQRTEIITNKYNLFTNSYLAESSYNNPKDMKDIFKELSKTINMKGYEVENIIKDMQANCESSLYDEVIDIFLNGKKKEVQNKNNKIIMNLILNSVKDNEVYDKYNALIPDNQISDNFFEELKINCFDLNVSKDKLYSAISLKNKDKYNDLHNWIIEKLNDSNLKEKLNIIAIDGEVKFKSSKYYRYICRVKEGGLLDKESTQLLIISMSKLYAKKVNNIPEGQFEYQVVNEIIPEMIHNNYLNYKLSKNLNEDNKSNKEKKLKI